MSTPPPKTDYIPRRDGDFASWARQFAAACDDERRDIPLTVEEVEQIAASVETFIAAWNAHTSAQAAAENARNTKDAARAQTEQLIRRFARFIRAQPAVTDAMRAELGLSVARPRIARIPAPTSRPQVSVQIPARLTHALRLVNEETAPGGGTVALGRGRPRGALGAEIYLALTPANTPAPASIDSYRFITLATRDTTTQTFPAADGGKTAHYQLRWLGSRGEKGPWSEVASATVAA